MSRWEYRVTYVRAQNKYPQSRLFGLWPRVSGYVQALKETDGTDLPVTEIVISRRQVGRWEHMRRWTLSGGDDPIAKPGVPKKTEHPSIDLSEFC